MRFPDVPHIGTIWGDYLNKQKSKLWNLKMTHKILNPYIENFFSSPIHTFGGTRPLIENRYVIL